MLKLRQIGIDDCSVFEDKQRIGRIPLQRRCQQRSNTHSMSA